MGVAGEILRRFFVSGAAAQAARQRVQQMQRDVLLWGLAVFLASLIACIWVYGGLPGAEAVYRAQFDSDGYRVVAEALWSGQAPLADRLAQRGYLYPMIAGGAALISPLLLFAVQLCATAATVMALVCSERILTGYIRVTPLALLSVSLLVAPAHLMTESLGVALVAIAIWRMLARPDHPGGAVALVLASLMKPMFWPATILMLLFSGWRMRPRWMLLLIALPVAVQLVLTGIVGGKSELTSTGRVNFEERFFSAVIGEVAGRDELLEYDSPFALLARAELPLLSDKIGYVASHPAAALRIWGNILWRSHLTAGSGFLQWDNAVAVEARRDGLAEFSRRGNVVLVLLLLPGFAGMAVFLRRAPSRNLPVAALLPVSWIAVPLVYYQGDRVILPLLVLPLPFVGLALDAVRRRMRRGRP